MGKLSDWFDEIQDKPIGMILNLLMIPLALGFVIAISMLFGIFLSCLLVYIVSWIVVFVALGILFIFVYIFSRKNIFANDILFWVGSALALVLTIYIIILNPQLVTNLMNLGSDYPFRMKP